MEVASRERAIAIDTRPHSLDFISAAHGDPNKKFGTGTAKSGGDFVIIDRFCKDYLWTDRRNHHHPIMRICHFGGFTVRGWSASRTPNNEL